MASVITIDENTFNTQCNDIFTSKSEFEKVISKFIGTYQDNDIEIKLPDCLTKNQRLIIHRYSKANEFHSLSIDTIDAKRHMSLYLRKNYVQKLILAKYNDTREVDDVNELDETQDIQTHNISTSSSSVDESSIEPAIYDNNENSYTAKKTFKLDVTNNNMICFICGFICGMYIDALFGKIKKT
jgi:hypothetical protein